MKLTISRRAQLALSVVVSLHEANSRVGGPELAERVATTTTFLSHVVKPLTQRGWVESTPGRAGGYELAADPNELSALDVIEAIEGVTDAKACVLVGGPCSSNNPCATHNAWTAAREAFIAELGSTPIASLSIKEGAA